jgi:DNA-binding response OmpR family regulator
MTELPGQDTKTTSAFAQAGPAGSMKVRKPANGKSILIVDDDKFLLDMYSIKFNEEGFGVDVASSGREAIERLSAGFKPDIILLDIVMPSMDGLTLFDTMKKQNLAPAAIVIILSNLGQREDIDRGVAMGAQGYIVKASSTPTEVVEKVKAIGRKNNLTL